MVIKKIKIKNFKTLKDFEIEPKPLTLLFGANSSGKSNFIRAMLFFKKNALPIKENYNDNNGQLAYKLNENVDLISFDEIVSDSDTSKKISFEFELNFDYCFPGNIFEPVTLINPFSDYLNGVVLNENISICFEFTKGSNKEYLSKVSFNDTNRKLNIDFNISEDENHANVNLDKSGLELASTFNIYKDNNNYHCSISNIPFYDISFKKFIDKFKATKNELEKRVDTDKKIIDDISLNDSYKLKEVEQVRTYYIYTSLIPSLLHAFFSEIHFPQLREIPKKAYILDNSNFGDKIYYNLLDSLYQHQKSLDNFLLKTKNKKSFTQIQKIKYFTAYINNLAKIREKLTDKEINDLFDLVWRYKGSEGATEIEKFKELEEINRTSREKGGKHYPIISKYEKVCNNSEKELILDLYENNYLIEGVYSSDYIFGKDCVPQFIRNISTNTNNMILKLGFNGVLFVNKKSKTGEITLIKENNKTLNVVNESSGFLQILPILLGLSLLKKSYDFSNEEGGMFSFQDVYSDWQTSFDFNSAFIKSLYIEQPELHLHPKLQTDFIKIVLNELNDFNIHNSIIMETHSEHIIRMIQLMVARGNISIDKVAVNYFDNHNGKTVIKNLRMAENGNFLDPWPNGFFDEASELTFELLKAQINRNN